MKPGEEVPRLSVARAVLAALAALLALAYVVEIVRGKIPKDQRVDAASLAVVAVTLLVVVMLLRPDVIERFRRLELSGFKLEMLESMREKQAKQQIELENMSLMLPLLLPPPERKHLVNLMHQQTANYKGNHAVRSELRRLRYLSLLAMRPDRHVSQMKDGAVFDLADYVSLTNLGRRWVTRIEEIEKEEQHADTVAES